MNKDRIVQVVAAMNYLAGRFTEMSHGKTKVNGVHVVMVKNEALKDMGDDLIGWADVIRLEMLDESGSSHER